MNEIKFCLKNYTVDVKDDDGKVVRTDEKQSEGVLPTRAHSNDAGLDLYSTRITQETDNSTITDFTTMYLMKLKTEHEIDDKVLIQINNFLKDVDSDVSIDLD